MKNVNTETLNQFKELLMEGLNKSYKVLDKVKGFYKIIDNAGQRVIDDTEDIQSHLSNINERILKLDEFLESETIGGLDFIQYVNYLLTLYEIEFIRVCSTSKILLFFINGEDEYKDISKTIDCISEFNINELWDPVVEEIEDFQTYVVLESLRVDAFIEIFDSILALSTV